MASTCKCEFCGSTISTADQVCPNCGAANPLYVIDTDRIITDPQTIEELQEYCAERGMPLARMRFFIGEDFKEPKAFGIYRDNRGDIVVYKNKADGTRAIRYKGKDERHAVNEIFGKLLEECHNRGIYPDGKINSPYMSGDGPTGNTGSLNSLGIDESIYKSGSYGENGYRNSNISNKRNSRVTVIKPKNTKLTLIIMIALFIFVAVMVINQSKHPSGYYQYDDTMYYHIGNSWYYYDDLDNDWYGVDNSITDTIYDGGRDYYYEGGWNSDWGESFYNSDAYEAYQESHSSDSDNDSGSSYDSWDSDSTDWSSDW